MHEHHIARTLTSEEQHRRMLQTPVPKLVLSLAAPTVASQLISIIYNTADTYFVSQISTSASAAVGVVFSLSSIIQAYGFGVAMGASSLISLRLGEKKDRDANGYASSGFFAELVGGLLILIFGLLFLEPLMRVLGATETMLPHACAYGRIILMGAPIMCCSFVLNCVLRAEGAAVVSMVGLCAGGLINIALDPLFIFTFEMGTAGAAIATVASQCVSLMILSISFLRGRSIVHLHPKYVSCHMRDYGQIIAVGFPTIARQGMASLASALMNIQGAIYGDAAVAALTISNKIYLLVRNVMIGIGQGFQPVAGYNYGAGRYDRVRATYRLILTITLVVGIAATLLFQLWPEGVVGIFGQGDPLYQEFAVQTFRIFLALVTFTCFIKMSSIFFQAVGEPVKATAASLIRDLACFVPLAILLPRFLGIQGILLAAPAADLIAMVVAVLLTRRFFRGLREQETAQGALPPQDP